jgi:hypothetical protein
MLPALLVVAGLFCVLLLFRFGGARRGTLVQQWPAILLAGAASIALFRGLLTPALGLLAAAALAWTITPLLMSAKRTISGSQETQGDAEARKLLGVGPAATEAEIRAAYRAKMSQAHPDRGGRHADAARLTAARDRLIRRGG